MATINELKDALFKMEQLKFDMDNAWEEEHPDMQIAIDAIKKQIPQKVLNPLLIKQFPHGIVGDCPVCGSKRISSADTNCCNACGQMLDFGNADDLIKSNSTIDYGNFKPVGEFARDGYKCPKCGYVNDSYFGTNQCPKCGYSKTKIVEYTADDEEPNCTHCDNNDAGDDFCDDCSKSGWSGYTRCEVVDVVTNADRIRNMNSEELAKVIEDGRRVFSCDNCPRSKDKKSFCTVDTCVPYIQKWLETEC